MRVLLYGFEAFGEEPANPSGVAVTALQGQTLGGAYVTAVVLPVTWAGAFPALQRVWDGHDAVLGVGQGQDVFSVEWWAHNVAGNRADNAGKTHAGREVVAGEEARIPVSVDVDPIMRAVAAVVGDRPVRASDSAGDFLCNHTLYRCLVRAADEDTVSGFLHVPRLTNCPQDVSTRAVAAMVEAVARGSATLV